MTGLLDWIFKKKTKQDNLHRMKNKLTSELIKTDIKARQLQKKSIEINNRIEGTVAYKIFIASGGKP